MRKEIIYVLMLSFLFTHEIDAAFRHEWRILPITSLLPDPIGRDIFIVAHIPLFAGLLLARNHERIKTGLAAFCVIHISLHWLLEDHPDYAFDNATSHALILGTGVLGLCFLLETWRARKDSVHPPC